MHYFRLYSLGFMSLGTALAPGNQGLLDQMEALKFVQSSIANFGGDPNQVTLMGQSAGSSSAMYHLMSPRSAGLFQRVIAQSGSNFSPSLHSITASEASRYTIYFIGIYFSSLSVMRLFKQICKY